MSQTIRLAIADDHAMFRQGVMTIAGRLDAVFVAEASNGQELLEKLAALEELPDICLVDINMPVMNGYATLREIKQRWPGMHVVALSMHAAELPIIKMLREGAVGYLLKDGPPEELLNALSSIKENGFYHSALIRKLEKKAGTPGRYGSAPRLTEREIIFLQWCCCDLTYKEIAQRMDISTRTVESYAKIVCDKLRVKSRIGLVNSALGMGLDPAE
jgi:two-component system invasion response regulator UvrY